MANEQATGAAQQMSEGTRRLWSTCCPVTNSVGGVPYFSSWVIIHLSGEKEPQASHATKAPSASSSPVDRKIGCRWTSLANVPSIVGSDSHCAHTKSQCSPHGRRGSQTVWGKSNTFFPGKWMVL